MNKFDTKVQLLKYKVLREIIRSAYDGTMERVYIDIPKKISPGPKASMRCCIYKERAILQERIKVVLGGEREDGNVVEVIDIACDECPIGGIYITSACRGCLTHRCMEDCPRDAIQIIDKVAVVDRGKCIECGKCIAACPYSAIIKQTRPCVSACKVKAISVQNDRPAVIDGDRCIACGACIYQCPFGAIQDKSYIMDAINLLKGSKNNENYRIYAILAPSIASQFKYAKTEQVATGLNRLGFHRVVEAALGADIALVEEVAEWKEKGVLTTSCCPAFVSYVEKNFPELKSYISSSASPMVHTARLIKKHDPTAKTVFIGPCSAKKAEFRLDKTEGVVDCVLSFEELQAFLDAREIDLASLPETAVRDASYYGRIFAKCGGIAEGLGDNARELGATGLSAVHMNGIEACRTELTRLKLGRATENFFEGMACEGGCVGGALCLTRGKRNVQDVERYAKDAAADFYNSVDRYSPHLDGENPF